ncbi:hypothetical protein GE061_005104 [Apolygus lucorum]|uniref:Uncharacterized protein n=1 Tax=Apolygus lucorum TaxID=248454 RepID=A0A8S9WX37_APOLU|nr:hypothetical protein GE061_005104 [Apolygus lucorum]
MGWGNDHHVYQRVQPGEQPPDPHLLAVSGLLDTPSPSADTSRVKNHQIHIHQESQVYPITKNSEQKSGAI